MAKYTLSFADARLTTRANNNNNNNNSCSIVHILIAVCRHPPNADSDLLPEGRGLGSAARHTCAPLFPRHQPWRLCQHLRAVSGRRPAWRRVWGPRCPWDTVLVYVRVPSPHGWFIRSPAEIVMPFCGTVHALCVHTVVCNLSHLRNGRYSWAGHRGYQRHTLNPCTALQSSQVCRHAWHSRGWWHSRRHLR